MRRALVLGLGLLVLLLGFYVAWPAWSARQIAQAIEARDAAALERKIDFQRVRERAKPLLSAELDRRLDQVKREGGVLGGAIAGQLKASLGDRLVENAIDQLFTPASIIELARRGGDFRRAIRTATQRTAGSKGTGQEAPPGSGSPPEAGTQPRKLGLANIKGFRLTGPLALAIDVARKSDAAEHDVTAEMAFTDGDWKVVGLVPRL